MPSRRRSRSSRACPESTPVPAACAATSSCLVIAAFSFVSSASAAVAGASSARLSGAPWDTKPRFKLFIDGVWKSGEGRDATTSSTRSTRSRSPSVPYATKADLDEALAASAARLARMARDWTSRSAAPSSTRRPRCCASAPISSPATMTQEQGKPLAEAKLETLASAQLFDWYAEDAKRDYGRTLVRPAGQVSRVIRQPVGPTATFTPWNFPIYLLAKKVSAALAAGCTVISRPPHETPGCRHRNVPRARRCRHSRRRRPAGPRRQRPGQRDADRQPRHPQGQLHRLDQRRQASHAAVRRQHDPRDDGAGRPRAGADLRRLRPRKDARHGRPAEVPERRPGVRLADPLLRPERHLRRVHQGLRRAHGQGEGRQRARGRREDGPARQPAPPRRDRRAGRRTPRPRARGSWPAASAATAASSSSRRFSPTSPTKPTS